MSEFKTRSALYLRQMNDDVKAVLDDKAKALGVAQWLIVEKVLENALGIDTSNTIDLNKWLGVNAQRARTGKPYKKEVKR